MNATATVVTVRCSCGNFPTSIFGKLRTSRGGLCQETIPCVTILARRGEEERKAREAAAEQARKAREERAAIKRAKAKRHARNKLARAEANRAVANGCNLKATRKMSK